MSLKAPLTEMHADMIGEIFNMGMGQGVASISKLWGREHEIFFEIPRVTSMSSDDFQGYICHMDVGIVVQSFRGPFSGRAAIYYPEFASKELARILIGTDIPAERLDVLEMESLMELGNIFINHTLRGLGNFISEKVTTDPPQLIYGPNILHKLQLDKDMVVRVDSDFYMEEQDLKGTVSFLLDCDALDDFVGKMDAYFKGE